MNYTTSKTWSSATRCVIQTTQYERLEADDIDDCKTLADLKAWSKRQSARRQHEFRTAVHPWMSNYLSILDSVELCTRAITIRAEEEWRKHLKAYAKKGWFPVCVSSFSRYERRAMTSKLAELGQSYVSRAYRSEDKYAIVHVVNDAELVIFFENETDREHLLAWAKQFVRPLLFSTKLEMIPSEVKRLLRGRNYYVLRGSNGTVISTEVLPSEMMLRIQSLL